MNSVLPRSFWGLNDERVVETNRLALRVLRDFPAVSVIDLHSPTVMLESGGKGCRDMRHFSDSAYDTLARLTMAAICTV